MQKHRSESVEARHGSQQIVAAQFSAFSSPLPPAGRGQYIGGGIAVLAIIGAVVASILGSTGAAVAIISTVMVPIGAAFALGKWHEKKS